MRQFFWMLGPAIGISASYQIGALADQIVGSLLPTGGLSAISYADRLYQLPGGVIVIATGSVLLKEMSMLIARGDPEAALHAQNRAASLTVALGAPFVVVFLLIPDLIIARRLRARRVQGERDASGGGRARGLFGRHAGPVRRPDRRGELSRRAATRRRR